LQVCYIYILCFFAVRDWINPVIPIVLIIAIIVGLIFGGKDSGGI